MKKAKIFFLIFFISVLIFPKNLFKLGLYTGYFSPKDSILKEIYGGGNFTYGLNLGLHIWNGFYLCVSGMQYRKSSKTSYTQESTILTLNPLNFSLRYTLYLGKINPYIAGGYTFIFFKESSDIGNIYEDGQGYSVDLGVEFKLCSWFIIDLGTRYTNVKVNPTGFDVHLGGWQVGLSFVFTI
jgi:opacity protein-like surface antigen